MSSGGSKELILIDEALTPDSSRYWPAEGYEPGKSQPSFDKQYLRDWMLGEGFVKGLEKGKDGNGWVIPSDIVEGTRKRYAEALETLTKK
jgi:phosphoribosylaminoimidazole-succinocarboxamide synthase